MVPWAGDHVPEHNSTNVDQAKNLLVYLSEQSESKATHRRFVLGAYYKNLFPGHAVIQPAANDYDLNLDIIGGGTSTLHIRFVAHCDSLLKAGVELGNKVKELSSQNLITSVRGGDFGSMHPIGYRNSKTGLEYKGTNECRKETLAFASEIGAYLHKNLPHVQRDIEEAEMLKMGDTPRCESFDTSNPNHRCGNTINISRDLGNPCHYDNDASYGCSLWLSQTGKSVGNWYFVLPHASIDGSKGVVIVLSHGVLITWHGNDVKHCTAIPEAEDDNEVFGIFVGSTSDPAPSRKK
jgi:hypothetical protein